jgi:hypothetical protein
LARAKKFKELVDAFLSFPSIHEKRTGGAFMMEQASRPTGPK